MSLDWNFDTWPIFYPRITSMAEVYSITKKNCNPFFRSQAKKILVGIDLLVLQQLSGINGILFYSSNIFKAAGEVLATGVTTWLVDKAGHRLLLISFVVFFSLRIGAIPWVIMSEIEKMGKKMVIVFLCIMLSVQMIYSATTTTTTEKANETAEEAKRKAEELKHSVGETVEEPKENTEGLGSTKEGEKQTGEEVTDTASGAAETASDMASKAAEKGGEASNLAPEKAREGANLAYEKVYQATQYAAEKAEEAKEAVMGALKQGKDKATGATKQTYDTTK
ncbi:hypothetical protein IFM89_004908 [Coptis chinensis]|uniref:Uncharacterized protein n=1 Tax=Coptis chinensis TaxID=261450 RepID=A0A835I0X5_9MAGN|nr:hypothetical protein IFM89_004908 [Coptis chinensis]